MTETAHDVRRCTLQQLDTALRLYFEGEDYYSVTTLAGAAEEILGKLLTAEGKQNAMESDTKDTALISEAFDEEELLPRKSDTAQETEQKEQALRRFRKEIVGIANEVRNSLKHWTPGHPVEIVFDAKKEAEDMLERAIRNYWRLRQHLTSAMERFDAMHLKDEPQLPN